MKTPLLLIDLGNTRVKWVTATVAGPIAQAFSGKEELPTSDLSAEIVTPWAKKYPSERVILACVVPRLVPIFRRAFGPRLTLVTGDLPELALPFAYPKPAEIGADRLAAAVAAHARKKFPALVVQCGTAIAYTALDRHGAVCGGAIAPGLSIQLHSLLGATAQLPSTHLPQILPRLPARSTADAIRSGVLLGYQGGIRETVARLSACLKGQPPVVLVTGGDAPCFPRLPGARREPLLVFEGLRIIGQRVLGHD
jgi:type III pantothenate kinase